MTMIAFYGSIRLATPHAASFFTLSETNIAIKIVCFLFAAVGVSEI
jgi:hypothetical protein